MTETKFTPGPWRAISMGGSSTVVSSTMPPRNDRRTAMSYGFRGEEFCIAAPHLEDDLQVRPDFVCFGHDDAKLIAAAPELYEVAEAMARFDGRNNNHHLKSMAKAALAKARGEA